MGIEKREYPRIKTLELLSFENHETTDTGLIKGKGETIDISFGGMCFESTKALPLGSEIRLSLTLGKKPFEAEGQIVSLNLAEDQTIMIHIKFASMSNENRIVIAEYLDACKTEQNE